MNTRFQFALIIIATISAMTSLMIITNPVMAQKDQGTPYVVQNTSKSMQDPLPGHQLHQIVIAAPPRSDGKIYSGYCIICH